MFSVIYCCYIKVYVFILVKISLNSFISVRVGFNICFFVNICESFVI